MYSRPTACRPPCPCRVTYPILIQALRIQREAEDKFKQFPNRLSSLVNWAMVLHTQNFDFDQARALYKQAAEISPENPVLLRAQAIFMLVSCEPPRQVVFKRAVDMLRSADIRDPKREKVSRQSTVGSFQFSRRTLVRSRPPPCPPLHLSSSHHPSLPTLSPLSTLQFKIAEDSLFHWAVVTNPTNCRALLNYAVLMQGVVKDFDMAEKFYRRALAEAPDDRYVVRNYEDFEAQRLPGGMYAGGGPSINILKNSEVRRCRVGVASVSRRCCVGVKVCRATVRGANYSSTRSHTIPSQLGSRHHPTPSQPTPSHD